MLTARDVWFGYDAAKPVLRGAGVTVPPAGIVGILGPNGSGKTTLLRLLAGARHPQRGAVTLDGAPLSGVPRAVLARRMAVVPQETHLAFDYTVAEVAMMGRYAHLGAFEIEGPSDMAIVEETLAATGVGHLRDRAFSTLSGGEKQRVVIATALAQIQPAGEFRLKAEATQASGAFRPKAEATQTSGAFRLKAEATQGSGAFRPKAETTQTSGAFRLKAEATGYLLLDEPTASLDLGYQLEVAALLRRLRDDRGVSIVISTHDLALAGALCERVLLVRDGEVVAEGTADATLTPDNVRAVYGVEVDVLQHSSGRRVLVPVGRTPGHP